MDVATTWFIAAVAAGSTILICFIVMCIVCCVRRRRHRRTAAKSSAEADYEMDDRDDVDTTSKAEGFVHPPNSVDSLLSELYKTNYLKIPSNRILIMENIGSGTFSNVYAGLYDEPVGSLPHQRVAVKTLLKHSSNEALIKLFQEAVILGQFQHPNVISLVGVVLQHDPAPLVILEYMKGKLDRHLRASIPNQQDLVMMATDIASGMNYLACCRFVVGNLAARSVLVTQDNRCKIGDVGLNRDISNPTNFVPAKIFVKWAALEILPTGELSRRQSGGEVQVDMEDGPPRVYTTESDIWSFGVVMYEIWNTGNPPYPKWPSEKVIRELRKGYRMPPPPGCPRDIYRIIVDCWHPDPKLRPSFAGLRTSIPIADTTVTTGVSAYPDIQGKYMIKGQENELVDSQFQPSTPVLPRSTTASMKSIDASLEQPYTGSAHSVDDALPADQGQANMEESFMTTSPLRTKVSSHNERNTRVSDATKSLERSTIERHPTKEDTYLTILPNTLPRRSSSGNDFGRQGSRPRSDNLGVNTTPINTAPRQTSIKTLSPSRMGSLQPSIPIVPATVTAAVEALPPASLTGLTNVRLRSQQHHSSKVSASPMRNSLLEEPSSGIEASIAVTRSTPRASDIFTRPPLLSSRTGSQADEDPPSSKQSSLKSKVNSQSHQGSVKSNISSDFAGFGIDDSELPLSAAERAPPGTELPMKASEDFRRQMELKRRSGVSPTFVGVAPIRPPTLPDNEDIIEEKDPRLADLRSSGKNIANWEAHVSAPKMTWSQRQKLRQQQEAQLDQAPLDRQSQSYSPPPGFLQ